MSHPEANAPRSRSRDHAGRKLGCAFGVLALLLSVGAFFWLSGRGVPGVAEMRTELRDRGRIVVVGGEDLLRLGAEGAALSPSSDHPAIEAALDAHDEEALDAALVEDGVAGLLVDGRRARRPDPDATLRERLAAYGHVGVLSGAYLTPTAALYLRRRVAAVESPLDRALGEVARGLLGGSPPPRTRSFPEPLRRSRNVEVMVLIEQGERARLWRSARGGSIARALITAASVARQRWAERERAMGGPLDDMLPRLRVRVQLLEEDGTLGERSVPFLERVFHPVHGVAFERRGSWHYLLPTATRERGEGSIARAYEALFDDAGMPADSLARDDLRPYRLVVHELAVSEPVGGGGASRPPLEGDPFAGELLDPAF